MALACRLLQLFLLPAALRCEQMQGKTKGSSCSPSKTEADIDKHFGRFIRKFDRQYVRGSKEYDERRALFASRFEEIDRHNCDGKHGWQADVNQFADRTDEERARLLGWRRHAKPKAARASGNFNFMLTYQKSKKSGGHGADDILELISTDDDLPESINWKNLSAIQHVRDQGDCGSCWAFASVTVLSAHAEIAGRDSDFSVQQIVSCTRNDHQCGGTGGCDGATAELAMDYVLAKGLKTEAEFKYQEETLTCPEDMTDDSKDGLVLAKDGANGGLSIGLAGWSTLPENKMEPLKRALVRMGPVAVSVAADSYWFMYSHGIMQSCSTERPIVNHAVVLVGFGSDDDLSGAKYWELQNSWGPGWGESGFMRIVRHEKDEEEEFCGIDDKPGDGVACVDNMPDTVTVCGSCGILYDSVVPRITPLKSDLLEEHSKVSSLRGVSKHNI